MSARFCGFCGKPVPAGATICPSCGAAVYGATGIPPPGFAPQPVPSSTPLGYESLPSMPWSFPLSGPNRAVDVSALSRVTLAAILAIAAGILGIVILVLNNVSGLLSVTASSSGALISLPSVWLWVGYLLGVAVLGLTELSLFRAAFHGLAGMDRTFSTPASLAIVAFVGLVLALVGLGIFLGALYYAVACIGSGVPLTSSCLPGTFWAGVAFLSIGGLIALIGYIGVLIGIWRLGTRYEHSWFKVGAILLIIPYINFVGALFILSAARRVRGQLETRTWPSLPH
jgi:hypothetical protein